jgi:hypothetical protein
MNRRELERGTWTFNQTHADRLLWLADTVQEAGRQRKYDQRRYPAMYSMLEDPCGCAEYHSDVVLKLYDSEATSLYYGLTQPEYCELFLYCGCGDAKRSGAKAARYIRRFVRLKLATEKRKNLGLRQA